MSAIITTLPCKAFLTHREETGRAGIGNITLPGGSVYAVGITGWRASTAEDGAAVVEFIITVHEHPEDDADFAAMIERMAARVRS
jgi:hypothetical protein